MTISQGASELWRSGDGSKIALSHRQAV